MAIIVTSMVGVVAAPPAGASTGISGSVLCIDGLNVEGIWIKANSGGSGWANFLYGAADTNFTYTLPYGGSYTVHVGCGGFRNNWLYTPNGNASTSATIVDWSCVTPDIGVGDYCFINGY